MNNFERYFEAVNFLEGLVNLPVEVNYMTNRNNPEVHLKRMRYFLNLLGNPDKKLKFIHITGTSGKGSVTNTIHEVLNSAGKKVGSFTSPYVTTSIEKIKVNDLYIDSNEFADTVDYLKPFIDKAYEYGPYGRPSYFEIFLAMALIYFQKQKCEWVVLEVGLGGRYDATNVIEKPVITAITNIDYDHTEILGNTLEKIAWDKAGIIKKGSVTFTTERRSSILKLFSNICHEKKVTLNILSKEKDYKNSNKKLVIAITKYLGIDTKTINKGLNKARLACRFETMQENPRVIIDGAHNRAKIKSTIDNIKEFKFQKLYLIISIADNKDHFSILKQLIPHADFVVFTRFQNKNRLPAQPITLLRKSKRYLKKGAKSKIYLDPKDALLNVLKIAEPKDLVLATGSFFLAGELRKNWYPEKTILEKRKI